jgi:fatty acid desaturase
MCNINYHLEHHLFPAVPWYNLPKLHRLLEPEYRRAGASSYRSYSAFFYDSIKAGWAGNLPNGRLIPAETRHAIGC